METEQDYYFTFCGIHKEKNCYVKIHGTFGSARQEMFNRFGVNWGFQYTEKEFGSQAEDYGLTEIENKIEG